MISLLVGGPLLALVPCDFNQSLLQAKMVHADHVALLEALTCRCMPGGEHRRTGADKSSDTC